METKSAIAVLEGKTIRAILCSTGDYVDLAPRLHTHWQDQDRVKNLIDQGYQQSVAEDASQPTAVHHPAVKFFNFSDFMKYFEKEFCEDYYLMDNGTWYYASAGERSVIPLAIKISNLKPTNFVEAPACGFHNH
jgi:hypothetical protein